MIRTTVKQRTVLTTRPKGTEATETTVMTPLNTGDRKRASAGLWPPDTDEPRNRDERELRRRIDKMRKGSVHIYNDYWE